METLFLTEHHDTTVLTKSEAELISRTRETLIILKIGYLEESDHRYTAYLAIDPAATSAQIITAAQEHAKKNQGHLLRIEILLQQKETEND